MAQLRGIMNGEQVRFEIVGGKYSLLDEFSILWEEEHNRWSLMVASRRPIYVDGVPCPTGSYVFINHKCPIIADEDEFAHYFFVFWIVPESLPAVPVSDKVLLQRRIIDQVLEAIGYYEVLGISKDAETHTIKRAYRKLALAIHPDKCNEPNATEAFKILNNAHETLSDNLQRLQYDIRHQAEPVFADPGPFHPWTTCPPPPPPPPAPSAQPAPPKKRPPRKRKPKQPSPPSPPTVPEEVPPTEEEIEKLVNELLERLDVSMEECIRRAAELDWTPLEYLQSLETHRASERAAEAERKRAAQEDDTWQTVKAKRPRPRATPKAPPAPKQKSAKPKSPPREPPSTKKRPAVWKSTSALGAPTILH